MTLSVYSQALPVKKSLVYVAKGYCAGIIVFEEKVQEEDLEEFFKTIKQRLLAGELTIKFASETQKASEVCVDIYEDHIYRHNLSVAFKP